MVSNTGEARRYVVRADLQFGFGINRNALGLDHFDLGFLLDSFGQS
jgi:hypothetical protein